MTRHAVAGSARAARPRSRFPVAAFRGALRSHPALVGQGFPRLPWRMHGYSGRASAPPVELLVDGEGVRAILSGLLQHVPVSALYWSTHHDQEIAGYLDQVRWQVSYASSSEDAVHEAGIPSQQLLEMARGADLLLRTSEAPCNSPLLLKVGRLPEGVDPRVGAGVGVQLIQENQGNAASADDVWYDAIECKDCSICREDVESSPKQHQQEFPSLFEQTYESFRNLDDKKDDEFELSLTERCSERNVLLNGSSDNAIFPESKLTKSSANDVPEEEDNTTTSNQASTTSGSSQNNQCSFAADCEHSSTDVSSISTSPSPTTTKAIPVESQDKTGDGSVSGNAILSANNNIDPINLSWRPVLKSPSTPRTRKSLKKSVSFSGVLEVWENGNKSEDFSRVPYRSVPLGLPSPGTTLIS